MQLVFLTNVPHGTYWDHSYALNLVSTPSTCIWLKFENWCDLRALSGYFCDKIVLSGKFLLFLTLLRMDQHKHQQLYIVNNIKIIIIIIIDINNQYLLIKKSGKWKVSGQFKKCPDNLENAPGWSGNCPDNLESYLAI